MPDPIRQWRKAAWIGAVKGIATVASRADEARVAERGQMLGNGRLRNVEAGRELGDAHFTLRETLEHGAARGVSQRAEDFRLDHRDVNISRYLYVLQLPPEKIAGGRARLDCEGGIVRKRPRSLDIRRTFVAR